MSAEGAPFFDKVFRITHHTEDEIKSFVQLTMSTGQVLELTDSHLLHVGSCCSLSTLVAAGDVQVGDTVFTVSFTAAGASSSPIAAKVVGVKEVFKTGVFNVHTLGASIVVNDVVASHFTDQSVWGANSRSLAPVWYQFVDMSSRIFGAEDASATLAPALRRE